MFCVRRFSSVTSKVQRRRDTHIQMKFPDYSGNEVGVSLPRRGRRMGGVFSDPLRSIGKLDGSTEAEPHLGEEKREKIKSLVSTDMQATLSKSRVTKMPTATFFPVIREEAELIIPSLQSATQLRESAASPFWVSHGAQFIDVESTAVPSVITSSLLEYRAAKTDCAVFDVSYQQFFAVTGPDSLLVLDHFVTGPLRLMKEGDVISTCLVDGIGNILTTATASQIGPTDYELCMAGNSRESVYRYLAQFVLHSRQSGLNVQMTLISHPTILHFHGPRRMQVLQAALSETNDPIVQYLDGLPSMARVAVGHVTVTNLTDHAIVTGLAPSQTTATPGGAYALDMLRMEAGRPRAGVDVSGSPISAGMAWSIDQAKVREKILFGHQRIARELVKTPKTRRVRIVADAYVYAGCALLSAPHRFPIGTITSCTWSPSMGKRMCQAMVKSEYCVEDTLLYVNIPHAAPESLDFRFKRRIAKQGNLQGVFRKLVTAKIIS